MMYGIPLLVTNNTTITLNTELQMTVSDPVPGKYQKSATIVQTADVLGVFEFLFSSETFLKISLQESLHCNRYPNLVLEKGKSGLIVYNSNEIVPSHFFIRELKEPYPLKPLNSLQLAVLHKILEIASGNIKMS